MSRFGWAHFRAGSSIDPKLVVASLHPWTIKIRAPCHVRLRDMDIHQDLMTLYGILLHLKGQSIHHLDLMRVAIFRCSARHCNGHALYLYRKPARLPLKTQFTHSTQFEAMRRRRNQRLPRVRRTKSHIDVCMNDESSVRPGFGQWERIIVNESGGPIKVSGHHHHSYCYCNCYYARKSTALNALNLCV